MPEGKGLLRLRISGFGFRVVWGLGRGLTLTDANTTNTGPLYLTHTKTSLASPICHKPYTRGQPFAKGKVPVGFHALVLSF